MNPNSNTNKRFSLFLGCAIPYRVSGYEISARKVLGRLGVQLEEMKEYNCCGLPIDPVNHEMMLVLAARNICLAERQGLDLVALCPGCAGTLRKVNLNLKEDNELKERINGHLKESDLEFQGVVQAKHLIQMLIEDVGLEKIKAEIKRPLTEVVIAEHAGCHLSRPAELVKFENPEDPEALKSLIEATGARYIEYNDKTACCGAPVAGVDDKIPLNLTREKLVNIRRAGAQAIVTACPFCHMMFDTNQSRIERMFSETFSLPVLHYPQLLGLAMGFKPEELALKTLRVDPSPVIASLNAKRRG